MRTGIYAMSPLEIDAAIELVRRFDRVIICSMGKPAFAVAKTVYTARSFGLDWHELDATHAFHGDMGVIKQFDLVIIVSKSGETKETTEVAKALFSEGHVTLAITSDPDSELPKWCTHKLIVPVMEEASPFGYAPMASTTLYMMVLHALLCEAIDAQGCTIEQYSKNHTSGAIGQSLAEAVKEKA